MTGLRPRRPSASMIVALVALFVALGGSSYAAVTLAKNSVGSKQLKKNAVTTPKIKNGAVTAQKTTGLLRSGSLQAWGFSSSSFIDNFTSLAYTPIASKTFTTPGSGFLLINGTIGTEADESLGGVGFLFYTLSLDGTRLESNNFAHPLSTDETNHVLGGTGAITDVVPVSGGTHSVDLLARESGSGDFIESRQLSILFVPSGSASAVPAVKTAAAVAQNPNK